MPRYIDEEQIDYKHYKQHRLGGEFNYDLLNGADNLIDAFYAGVMYIHECIKETPTADVYENVRGEWEMRWYPLFKQNVYVCKVCDKYSPLPYDYCPNCRADMRQEKANEWSIDPRENKEDYIFKWEDVKE